MAAEMALRLSGRFRVIWPISPAISRRSVGYIPNLLSIHERSMSVFCANFLGHFEGLFEPCRFDSGIGASFAERRKHILGGDIADQIISGKRAAAKSGQRAVKAPASRFIRSQAFLLRIFRPAVQVHAELDSCNFSFDLLVELADNLRCVRAYRLGQSNGALMNVFKPLPCIRDDLRPP